MRYIKKAFDDVKAIIARDLILAYPVCSKESEIYTDTSSRQIVAVITQQNRPSAFFSGNKLSDTQQKYSVTEIELLAIVGPLKEFKGMRGGSRSSSTETTKILSKMPYDSLLTEYTSGGYFWKNLAGKEST
jgi:hypothetical protein